MLQQQWLALPRLIRFMALHFADGVALGWACGLLLIRYDICQIGSLLAKHDGTLMMSLFFAQTGLLFGTFAMSVGVMNLREDE